MRPTTCHESPNCRQGFIFKFEISNLMEAYLRSMIKIRQSSRQK